MLTNKITQEKLYLWNSLSDTITVMLEEEVNHSQLLKAELGAILNSPSHPLCLDKLDQLKRIETWQRIKRGEVDFDIRRHYILPTVILFPANSKVHEIETRMAKAANTDDDLIRTKENQEV